MPGADRRVPEVVVIEPHDFSETLQAIQALRESKIVILKLSELEPSQVQRAVDIAGGACAISCYTKWVGEQTFLFTPNSVTVSIVNNN
jgi:cell division inhibitor SepF